MAGLSHQPAWIASTGLGEPFLSVDEQVFVVPEIGSHEVVNEQFKVVSLLRGDCHLDADGYDPVRIERGDVLIVPEVCRYRYRRPSSQGGLRIHAVRLLLDPRFVPPRPAGQSISVVAGNGDDGDMSALARDRLRRVAVVSAKRIGRGAPRIQIREGRRRWPDALSGRKSTGANS